MYSLENRRLYMLRMKTVIGFTVFYENTHATARAKLKIRYCSYRCRPLPCSLFSYGAAKHVAMLKTSRMEYNFNAFCPSRGENIYHT